MSENQYTIIPTSNENLTTWDPVVGESTRNLLERINLTDDEKEQLLKSSLSILSKGVNPNDSEKNNKTGLVIGYIQSGKTLSFSTVASLCKDNGFAIVIVITGISKILYSQSEKRLIKDLDIYSQNLTNKWYLVNNYSNTDSKIRVHNARIKNGSTLLIPVMKNHTHLSNLVKLIESIELNNKPVLIIDDEADQASLNTKVKKYETSTTYNNLLELIETVAGNYLFLQYTATPQAPLLINIYDTLSPDFCDLIYPGN